MSDAHWEQIFKFSHLLDEVTTETRQTLDWLQRRRRIWNAWSEVIAVLRDDAALQSRLQAAGLADWARQERDFEEWHADAAGIEDMLRGLPRSFAELQTRLDDLAQKESLLLILQEQLQRNGCQTNLTATADGVRAGA